MAFDARLSHSNSHLHSRYMRSSLRYCVAKQCMLETGVFNLPGHSLASGFSAEKSADLLPELILHQQFDLNCKM